MSDEENTALVQGLRRANLELTQAFDATIEGIARALDLREGEPAGHTNQVTQFTIELARSFGIHEDDLVHIRHGALLHDIGKLGIPENVLRKPSALSAEDWVIMHMHPQYAYDLLSPIEYLYPALDIPYCHHEKWDGSGYPRGLNGELIPFAARLFAVMDVWDALISPRPYRAAWTQKDARDYILAEAGRHFDPAVVKAFMNREFAEHLTASIGEG
jgi:response regulator RpfG family c-di-GMP phosphodiesterase